MGCLLPFPEEAEVLTKWSVLSTSREKIGHLWDPMWMRKGEVERLNLVSRPSAVAVDSVHSHLGNCLQPVAFWIIFPSRHEKIKCRSTLASARPWCLQHTSCLPICDPSLTFPLDRFLPALHYHIFIIFELWPPNCRFSAVCFCFFFFPNAKTLRHSTLFCGHISYLKVSLSIVHLEVSIVHFLSGVHLSGGTSEWA